jgi:hypothetical protein
MQQTCGFTLHINQGLKTLHVFPRLMEIPKKRDYSSISGTCLGTGSMPPKYIRRSQSGELVLRTMKGKS